MSKLKCRLIAFFWIFCWGMAGWCAAASAEESRQKVSDYITAERRAASVANWWRYKFKNDNAFGRTVPPVTAPVPPVRPAFQHDVEEEQGRLSN